MTLFLLVFFVLVLMSIIGTNNMLDILPLCCLEGC